MLEITSGSTAAAPSQYPGGSSDRNLANSDGWHITKRMASLQPVIPLILVGQFGLLRDAPAAATPTVATALAADSQTFEPQLDWLLTSCLKVGSRRGSWRDIYEVLCAIWRVGEAVAAAAAADGVAMQGRQQQEQQIRATATSWLLLAARGLSLLGQQMSAAISKSLAEGTNHLFMVAPNYAQLETLQQMTSWFGEQVELLSCGGNHRWCCWYP